MKIFNGKLAARIRANEELVQRFTVRLTTDKPGLSFTSADYHREVAPIQERINKDIATLAAHGYDKRGKKVQG
jgi:hypothetical protein